MISASNLDKHLCNSESMWNSVRYIIILGPRQDGRPIGKNINKKQLLVKNFSPSLDESAMEQWMEFICDKAVSNVKFSYDKKSAIVGFKRPVEISKYQKVYLKLLKSNFSKLHLFKTYHSPR